MRETKDSHAIRFSSAEDAATGPFEADPRAAGARERAGHATKAPRCPPRETRGMHCYSCGSLLDQLPPTVCTSCGVHHWNDAKPTGIALVRHEGRLLLVRRAIDPYKGYWDCPGGFCNEAEHPIAAAEREVFEEAGIEVRVTGYVGAWYETHEDPELPEGLIKRTLGFFYHAVPVAGTEPTLSEETSEVRWFLPGDVPPELAFPEQQLPAFDAWQKAMAEGRTTTPLPDRPQAPST